MLSFILNQILFYIAIFLVLFVPGYFLLLAVEAKKKLFSTLERFIFSFGFSIIIIDLLMMLAGRMGILFTRFSIVGLILLFSAVCFVIYKKRKTNVSDESPEKIFSFSKNQKILIIILLFLTIFIKTAYFKNSIFPTSTDLGHHMYWTKMISETGKLPVYQESDIIQVDGKYQVSQPQKIADFIIGEHLPLAAIQLISNVEFISYFPALVLFLVNIFGILAIFILTLRLFENFLSPTKKNDSQKTKDGYKNILPEENYNNYKKEKFLVGDEFGKNAAIISLFLMGPLYAISSSQAKFASGGVIGNTIGNLLIPMALYFLFLAFSKKSALFLSLSIFTLLGMAYTHHLTTFIFIFIFFFIAIIFSILNFNNLSQYAKEWMKIILKPQIFALILISILFVLLVYTPTYLDAKAVGTAVGGPSKDTRAGLTFNQLKLTAGEARMIFGLIGIAILMAIKKRKNYEVAFVLGWAVSILVMSLWPQILLLDLPSARIANYASFPLAISGAFAIAYVLDKLKSSDKKYYTSQKMFYVLCFMLFIFAITSGFSDNSQSLKASSEYQKALQTINASNYISKNVSESDLVIKDHNYITADSYIKLSFMNGYNYPFSRGYFKRYEDTTKPREMCTLSMISTPNTVEGQKCFTDLGVDFVMLNPLYDSAQFEKSNEFWKVYGGKEISVYYKKEL